MSKPTADECLDVLAQLWERNTPVNSSKKMGVMLDEIEENIPGWTKNLLRIAARLPEKDREYMYKALGWRRCRELLRRAKRIQE